MARGVGGRGPANIMKHTKGLKYPTTKDKIVENARNAEGPDTDQVLEVLEQIPDRDYQSPAEIMKEVGKIE